MEQDLEEKINELKQERKYVRIDIANERGKMGLVFMSTAMMVVYIPVFTYALITERKVEYALALFLPVVFVPVAKKKYKEYNSIIRPLKQQRNYLTQEIKKIKQGTYHIN